MGAIAKWILDIKTSNEQLEYFVIFLCLFFKWLKTVKTTRLVVIQYNFEFKHDKYPLESYYFVNTHPMDAKVN